MAAEPRLLPALLFCRVLEQSFRARIAHGSDSPRWLSRLTGKVIALRILPFDRCVYLCPTDSDIQVHTEITGDPDLVVSGSPLAYAKAGAFGVKLRDLFARELEITGDSDTGRHFQKLLESLRVDCESSLAAVAGEALAAQVSGSVHDLERWTVRSAASLRQDLAEFLQEESATLPSPASGEMFAAQVADLRDDCERLEARIARLTGVLRSSPEKAI